MLSRLQAGRDLTDIIEIHWINFYSPICWLYCIRWCKSMSVLIACSFLVIVLPIVPVSGLLLLSCIDFFFVTVGIFLVGLLLFLLSFHSLDHILVLEFSNFLKSHCWFVSILLPDLGDKIFPLFGRTHALMDGFLCWHLPYFYLWNRLAPFFFVFFHCHGIFLDWLLVFEDL